MPPHDTDNNLVFAVRDKDGNLITLQEATEDMMQTEPVEYQQYCNPEDFELDIKLLAGMMRHRGGLIDVLYGNSNTPSAKRYIRSVKRYREKERREKLKGGVKHED